MLLTVLILSGVLILSFPYKFLLLQVEVNLRIVFQQPLSGVF